MASGDFMGLFCTGPQAAHRERLAAFEGKQAELERAREQFAVCASAAQGPYYAGQLAIARAVYAMAAREARAADAEERCARLRMTAPGSGDLESAEAQLRELYAARPSSLHDLPTTEEAMEWHYQDEGGAEMGPFSIAQLRSWVAHPVEPWPVDVEVSHPRHGVWTLATLLNFPFGDAAAATSPAPGPYPALAPASAPAPACLTSTPPGEDRLPPAVGGGACPDPVVRPLLLRPDDVSCETCRGGEHHGAPLVICEGCDRGYHAHCLGMLGTWEPRDEFVCSDCAGAWDALPASPLPSACCATQTTPGLSRGGRTDVATSPQLPASAPLATPRAPATEKEEAVEALPGSLDLDVIACEVCGTTEDEENLMLCDSCDVGAAHVACAGLPCVPKGDWHCSKCTPPASGGIADSGGAPSFYQCERKDGRSWQCKNEAVEGQRFCTRHSNRNKNGGTRAPSPLCPAEPKLPPAVRKKPSPDLAVSGRVERPAGGPMLPPSEAPLQRDAPPDPVPVGGPAEPHPKKRRSSKPPAVFGFEDEWETPPPEAWEGEAAAAAAAAAAASSRCAWADSRERRCTKKAEDETPFCKAHQKPKKAPKGGGGGKGGVDGGGRGPASLVTSWRIQGAAGPAPAFPVAALPTPAPAPKGSGLGGEAGGAFFCPQLDGPGPAAISPDNPYSRGTVKWCAFNVVAPAGARGATIQEIMDGSRAWRDWGAVKYPENVLRMSLWTDVAFSHIGLKTYALFSKVELASPAAPGGCARAAPASPAWWVPKQPPQRSYRPGSAKPVVLGKPPEREEVVQREESMLRVAPSHIHGLGLFAREDIPPRHLVAEYRGEVLRESVSGVRAMRYAAGGRTLHMLPLGEGFVLDATAKGSSARFINHSCEPNCVCVTITLDGQPAIGVYSGARAIREGEELCYDYRTTRAGEDLCFDTYWGGVPGGAGAACRCRSAACGQSTGAPLRGRVGWARRGHKGSETLS